jgi:hypothetical protein
MPDEFPYCASQDTPYWKFRAAGEAPAGPPDGTIPQGSKVVFPAQLDPLASYMSARFDGVGRVLVRPSDFGPCP